MQHNISLEKLLMTLTYILNISQYSNISAPKLEIGMTNLTQEVCHVSRIQELSKIIEAATQRSSQQLSRLAAINAQLDTVTAQMSGVHICASRPNGVATVFLNIGNSKQQPTQVLCSNNKYGSGWMLITHRNIGSRLFASATETQWRKGFGDVNGEFYIGAEKMQALTAMQLQELLIVSVQANGVEHFDRFSVFALDKNYVVSLLGRHSSDRGSVGTAANNPKAIHEKLKTIAAFLNPKTVHLQLDIYMRPTVLERILRN